MLQAGGLAAKGIDARVQKEHLRLPFDGAQFDFVTAVCVFHHIPVDQRSSMVREMRRVLKRGGTAAIIEHNPYNPATRIIVSRTPVDADAVLLSASETCNLLRSSGFGIDAKNYFLLFPQSVYKGLYWLEKALTNVPLGGQYTVFARAT
jgi:SAM-dependent methyltransferase